ncbi:hypothetical protein OSB04_028489 [Centaurea solstitialis]|uniref:Integrase catalytic domain-containing protein n=1 Tax=Centaurea solstitialis TaxID=347529 RepID=A0AA38SN81_9ASTR|nr:hypothetical protein OSB04_028489 [Centaurea solstitialis]
MASNLNHATGSSTSNGSMPLDLSRKVALMQLLRQNQHLMQLLLRKQFIQQPMSWTMGMHSLRLSTSGNFWIFYSGCFNHMSPYPASFITKQPSQHPTFRTADLTPKPVLFSGNFSTDTIQLPDVLHVPGLAIGLVSLAQLQEMGLLISFDFSGCVIQDPKTKQILGKGRRVGRILKLSIFAYLCLRHTQTLLRNITSNEVSCLSCKLGKHHALPFELNDYTSVSAFDLIHSDVWGPAPHPSMGGCRESSLIDFLRSQGTISQYSCPGTSPQNGRAERKHRHILDTIRTLLISAKCPERFWGEAAFTAVYTINIHPTPILHNKSPMRLFMLEPRSRLCLFLGYGIEHKGYRCWDPISKRLRISRHVTFWEHVPFYTMPNSNSETPISIVPFFTDSFVSLDLPSPIPTPNSEAPTHVASLVPSTHIPPPPGSPDPVPVPPTQPSVLSQQSSSEPSVESTDPGLSSSDNVRRSNRAAMQEELQALAKAQTWDSVPLPPGKRPIGSKWVFKIKTRSDGSIDRYKARLVAKGFNQDYGIDYEDTFAPVARVTSVRSLLAIATTKHWPLFQMDVKNAFLNDDLSEEVYMTPPPGVSLPSGHVCRLHKALYGLKQAPRAWFEKFSNTVLSLGFSASNYDFGLFTRTTDSSTILLLLYVDEMIITGSDTTDITHLKQFLSSSFEIWT